MSNGTDEVIDTHGVHPDMRFATPVARWFLEW